MTLKNCKCGKSLEESTFMSLDFDYDGGTMVFVCDCGKEHERSFLPQDLIGEREQFKIIMEMEMGKEMACHALTHYDMKRVTKKLESL